MTGRTLHAATHRELALVAEHRFEFCGFTDQTQARLDGSFGQLGQHGTHAQTADFLVIGKRQMQGLLERRAREMRHRRQRTGDEALHVRHATPIQTPIALQQLERIDGPRLPVHRHHIRVARHRNARLVGRSDGGEQAGLVALGVVEQFGLHAMLRKIVAHEDDQVQIRVTAHGGKTDEPLQHLAAAEFAATHRPALRSLAQRWDSPRASGSPASAACRRSRVSPAPRSDRPRSNPHADRPSANCARPRS